MQLSPDTQGPVRLVPGSLRYNAANFVLRRPTVSCEPDVLKKVPLFALLDDQEAAVLAREVEIRNFSARQRIYKMGDPGGQAYVMVSGIVQLTTVDEDQQEVVVDQPAQGEFFGFASMLEQTPHQTTAVALEGTTCLEVDRHDIQVLLERMPHAGMDMLTVLGKQYHASQRLIRIRAARNPNAMIEQQASLGERVADRVAGFGGSWTFITAFLVALVIYAAVNVALARHAWDPYPFILLNLILSMLAAIQAPIIMMSQNRQDTKDRLRSELDFEVNRRSESEIQGLARKLNLLGDKIGDIDDLVQRRLRESAS